MAKPVKLSNVTLFWANLAKPSTMSGKYQVDLSKLTSRQVEGLEKMGVSVNNKGDDREFFVTCKSTYAIDAYDEDGTIIRGAQVGNDSKADVVVTSYDWKSPTGKKGTSLGVNKLVITDLAVFESNDEIDMNDVEEL